MLDTCVFVTPQLPQLYIDKIQTKFKIYSCIDGKTGELEYKITSGNLAGSFDNKISVRVNFNNSLKISCSLHKLIVGHNIFGGSDNLRILANTLKKILQETFEVKLPNIFKWEVKQLDYALTFNLGSQYQVSEYINSLREACYARREINVYGKSGIHIPGTTTTIKFYNKKEEYLEHDYKRIKKVFGERKADELLNKAEGLIRIEVAVKAKKIKSLFPKTKYRKELLKIHNKTVKTFSIKSDAAKRTWLDYKNKNEVTVKDIDMNVIIKCWNEEVNKVIKENQIKDTIINTSGEVIKQLSDMYNSRTVAALYGFWTLLSTKGEEHAKTIYPKSTYYRYRDYLIKAGISWRNTDVKLIDNSNIVKFVPKLDSEYLYDLNTPNKEFRKNLYRILKRAV